jgi:DNA-binding GntR family transcriptional regulator
VAELAPPSWSRSADDVDPAPRPSHRSLSDWTRQRLHAFLLEGHWDPGQVVHEVPLSEELGVSRSPIREALTELERDGLLVRAGQGGRRHVVRFEEADIEELYDIRSALECLAVRYVAADLLDEVLDRLEGLLGEMRAVDPGDEGRGRSFAADFEFHELIVRAAGRSRLYEMLRRTWLQTRVLLAHGNRRGVYPSEQELGRVVGEHEQVYEALRRHDVAAAVTALEAHIQGAKARVLRAIQQDGSIQEGA